MAQISVIPTEQQVESMVQILVSHSRIPEGSGHDPATRENIKTLLFVALNIELVKNL